jgi:hypothetical protein
VAAAIRRQLAKAERSAAAAVAEEIASAAAAHVAGVAPVVAASSLEGRDADSGAALGALYAEREVLAQRVASAPALLGGGAAGDVGGAAAGGGGCGGTTATAEVAPLARLQLDAAGLEAHGLGDGTIGQIYRTLYIFLFSFGETAHGICGQAKLPWLNRRMWQAYTELSNSMNGWSAPPTLKAASRRAEAERARLVAEVAVAQAEEDRREALLPPVRQELAALKEALATKDRVAAGQQRENGILQEKLTSMVYSYQSLASATTLLRFEVRCPCQLRYGVAF